MTTTTKQTKDTTKEAAKEPKVIKRYANRKLYDTERSCYVTLEEISQMIKDGDDVKVVDNKTKDDLTAVTLAQIIVEEEKKVQKMPLKLLRSIIQSGNEAIGELYQDKVADPVKRLRDDVQTRVDALFKRDGKADDPPATPNGSQAPAATSTTATSSASPDSDPNGDVKAGVVKEFVHSTTEAFETWQKRIDERVRDTLQKTLHRPDLDALKTRVEALEARIRDVEAKKKT